MIGSGGPKGSCRAVTTARVTISSSRLMTVCFGSLDIMPFIGACMYVQRAGRESGPFV